MSRAWPITGLLTVLRHPSLLGWPLLALLVSWAAVLAVFVAVLISRRPPADASVFATILGYLWALGLAGGTAALLGMLLQPLLLSCAIDTTARQRFAALGLPPATEESTGRAIASTLRVVVQTMPGRVATVVVAFLGPLLAGPVGLGLAAAAVARIAVIDAIDTSLAVRGLSGAQRLAALSAHRQEIVAAIPAATATNIGLSLTVVGWLLWLPALVAGAASLVSTWPEVRGPSVSVPSQGA